MTSSTGEPGPLNRVSWPVQTIRDDKKFRLWISVDSIMGFRNQAGQAGWPVQLLALLDHIIIEAQKADRYGKDIE